MALSIDLDPTHPHGLIWFTWNSDSHCIQPLMDPFISSFMMLMDSKDPLDKWTRTFINKGELNGLTPRQLTKLGNRWKSCNFLFSFVTVFFISSWEPTAVTR